MGRRVDVDETLSPEPISPSVLHELYRHAREALPEECCGLILGDDGRRFGQLVRCRNQATQQHQADPTGFPRDGREAFYMNPGDYAEALALAEATARRVTAVYHSHVEAAVYLSEMDLEYAEHELFPFPDADHIVVAVVQGEIKGVGLFQRGSEGFRGRPLAPREP